MALAATAGVDQATLCGTWEELDGNADLLEKQLQRLKVKSESTQHHIGSNGLNGCSDPVVLDSTREESLRTQYVSPEPKVKILSRPKHNNHQPRSHGHHHKHQSSKSGSKSKTLEQREQEYAEARMRILGDVKYEAEEAQVQAEVEAESAAAALSPAELLKLKVAEAMKGEEGFAKDAAKKANGESASHALAKKPKKIREKIKTSNPEPTRDFPVHKTESDRIIRHPRGPDGTPGFNYNRH